MDEQTLRMLVRLAQSPDGTDYIAYLGWLSKRNYEEWKQSGSEVLRGKAIAIDNLVQEFSQAADKLNSFKKEPEDTW